MSPEPVIKSKYNDLLSVLEITDNMCYILRWRTEMRKKYKRILSQFLIAFMLIIGMSYANIMEDSFFSVTSVQTSSGQEVFCQSTIIDSSLSMMDLLTTRSESFVQQTTRSTNAKLHIRIATDYLHVNAAFSENYNSYLAFHVTQFPEQHCYAALIDYIHNQSDQK